MQEKLDDIKRQLEYFSLGMRDEEPNVHELGNIVHDIVELLQLMVSERN